jgi:hypothetical protein
MAKGRKARNYDRDNELAACVILSNSAKYDGLPLEWARLWMSRHGTVRKQPDRTAEKSCLDKTDRPRWLPVLLAVDAKEAK